MLFLDFTVLLQAVFLVNNVALLEQQARVCEAMTGLPTKRFLYIMSVFSCETVLIHSFCGADGIDDWTEGQWASNLRRTTVLVFIHDVFLIALSRYAD